MRALGSLALVLVLCGMPLASACYRPRVDSCRGPLGDFSGISNVRIVTASRPLAFEGGSASVAVTVQADAPAMSGDTCVGVHAELHDAADGIVDTLDTPLHATVTSGVLQVSSIFFYHSSFGPMTVHVTLLGTTVDAVVVDPFDRDAFFSTPDAFVTRDAGPILRDGGPRDASLDASDAGDDTGASDASTDASSDASDDAAIDTNP